MKPALRVALWALLLAGTTGGLAFAALMIDPWTGESSDFPVALKFITVPLVLCGLPMLIGVGICDMWLGRDSFWLWRFLLAGVFQYAACLVAVVLIRVIFRARSTSPDEIP